MSIHAFTSESYSENDRIEAWQDVLGGFGLRSSPLSVRYGEHATALSRASLDGVGLMRFAAGPQVFSPLPRRADLPILLMPAEDGAVLNAGGSPQTVPAGRIILLPRQNDWRVTFHRDMRAIVLSVTAESFGGRKISLPECRDAVIVASDGLADILGRTLEVAAEALETLSPEAWNTIRLSLAEMLLTLARQKSPNAAETPASAPGLRCCNAFMTRSNASSAIPRSRRRGSRRWKAFRSDICRKLFEATGDNFTHYLRERRLQRCSADLGRRHAIASIGIRYRVWLRLQRRRAFQPLVSRPVRNVAARIPATAGS